MIFLLVLFKTNEINPLCQQRKKQQKKLLQRNQQKRELSPANTIVKILCAGCYARNNIKIYMHNRFYLPSIHSL